MKDWRLKGSSEGLERLIFHKKIGIGGIFMKITAEDELLGLEAS